MSGNDDSDEAHAKTRQRTHDFAVGVLGQEFEDATKLHTEELERIYAAMRIERRLLSEEGG